MPCKSIKTRLNIAFDEGRFETEEYLELYRYIPNKSQIVEYFLDDTLDIEILHDCIAHNITLSVDIVEAYIKGNFDYTIWASYLSSILKENDLRDYINGKLSYEKLYEIILKSN